MLTFRRKTKFFLAWQMLRLEALQQYRRQLHQRTDRSSWAALKELAEWLELVSLALGFG